MQRSKGLRNGAKRLTWCRPPHPGKANLLLDKRSQQMGGRVYTQQGYPSSLPLPLPVCPAPESGCGPSPKRPRPWAPLTGPGALEAAQRGQHRRQEPKERPETHGRLGDRTGQGTRAGCRCLWAGAVLARGNSSRGGARGRPGRALFLLLPLTGDRWVRVRGWKELAPQLPGGCRPGRSGGCRNSAASPVGLSWAPRRQGGTGTLGPSCNGTVDSQLSQSLALATLRGM